MLRIFSMLNGELEHFHSDSMLLHSNETLIQKIFRIIESCVKSMKQSGSWTCFNSVSWRGIVLGKGFSILDVHALKMEMCMQERWKTLGIRVWIHLSPLGSIEHQVFLANREIIVITQKGCFFIYKMKQPLKPEKKKIWHSRYSMVVTTKDVEKGKTSKLKL